LRRVCFGVPSGRANPSSTIHDDFTATTAATS
jgi:hypothetical protein